MSVFQKAKDKVGEKLFDKVLDMIEKIDMLDQLAEMVKTIVPCKLEATVKGKKTLEINLHGIKNGQLWISVKRIREDKPAEKPAESMTNDENNEPEP